MASEEKVKFIADALANAWTDNAIQNADRTPTVHCMRMAAIAADAGETFDGINQTAPAPPQPPPNPPQNPEEQPFDTTG